MLNEVHDQLGITRLFANSFQPQGNAKEENVHYFLTKFLGNSNLEWNKPLPFTCYCYNIFPGSNGTESQFSLGLDKIQQKDICLTLTIITDTTAQIKAIHEE